MSPAGPRVDALASPPLTARWEIGSPPRPTHLPNSRRRRRALERPSAPQPAGAPAGYAPAVVDAEAFPNPRPPYRLELLPIVPPFYRRARQGVVDKGELVYYGPAPVYYGIGEVIEATERFVLVDFRGTGVFGVHEETMERQYVLPVPNDRLALL